MILDIKMFGLNRYVATRKIREFYHEVVIIDQTAFALKGDNEKVFAIGCIDSILRPINKDGLENLLQKQFGK